MNKLRRIQLYQTKSNNFKPNSLGISYFCAMRWFRFAALIVLFLLGIYWVSMYYFVDESKSFTVEKEINYPIEKVFPQFNNLQNFARWNNYFAESKTMAVDFYSPYEGKGSALSFDDKKNDVNGEMFIRYENPNKTLKYQLFEGKKNNPTNIDIKFVPVSATKTKIIWYVHTPKKSVMKRAVNLWTEDDFAENLDKSMVNLRNLLGNKVEKDQFLTDIKYDSLMVEKQEGQLILGINVTTSNKKDALFKNIILNHNKVYNFVTNDLDKRDDEFGFPMLMTNPNNFKDKEVSYFIGIPLSKRIGVADNSFSFRTINESEAYVMYFKGNYANRVKTIQQLMLKAKRDSMRNGEIQQVFLEAPEEGKDVLMKMSLPVFR